MHKEFVSSTPSCVHDGAPGRPTRLSARPGNQQVLTGDTLVGLLKLSARALVSPSNGDGSADPAGRSQAVLSNRVKAELHLYHSCHHPRSSRGCNPAPARIRVRLRHPHCSEGRGLPAPGPARSPVEQMIWPGVCRAGRVLCLLGGVGYPRPAPHSVGRQSRSRGEPSLLHHLSRLPTSRPLPFESSDWSAPLQRGREAGGSREQTRLPIGQTALPIEEGGSARSAQSLPPR